jgi:hypothetical protein
VQDYKLHAEGWLHEIMRCLNIDGSVFITGTYHNIGDEIDVSVVIDYPVAFHPGQETPRCCTASVDRPTFARSNGASVIASSRPTGVPLREYSGDGTETSGCRMNNPELCVPV